MPEVMTIWYLQPVFKKSNIGRPQQPQTEKVWNQTWYFMIPPKIFFSKNIKMKLSSITWMTLKSSVVIFTALELLLSQWPQQPHFNKGLPESDGWIIPGTKMTNTGPSLRNEESKFQFFTDIWYLFCWRLLRPTFIIFLYVLENNWPQESTKEFRGPI